MESRKSFITIKEPEQPDECFAVEILAEGASEPSANYYKTMRGARIAATHQMKRGGSLWVGHCSCKCPECKKQNHCQGELCLCEEV